MLQALDVIKVFDTEIDPANWKRVVCICPSEGLFYRINTYDDFPIGVLLPVDPYHGTFLKWDSYLQCGKYPLELDDFQISEAIKKNNGRPLGKVHQSYAQAIYDAVCLQKTIPNDVKALIKAALGC